MAAQLFPRSPPSTGKRLPAEVQILEKEIVYLKDELRSLDGLHSVSQGCREVHEFVSSNPDPLVPINKKHKSCSFWNWIRKKLCCNCSWICCSCFCTLQLKTFWCSCCSSPCCKSGCLKPGYCCPGCSCGCVWSCCPNCRDIPLCPTCSTKSCCGKGCLC